MLTKIRSHWSKITTGLVVLTALGIGGARLYQHFEADSCCKPGAACCYPGAACCKAHSLAQR